MGGVRGERIRHGDDPRLDPYRGVLDPLWLRERGLFLAEGRQLVRALIRAPGFRVHSLLATDTALESLEPELSELPAETPVYRAAREVMTSVSGVRFHQGCVAAGERRCEPSVAELLAACGAAGVVVVLERVTDPDNVGSIFRSAGAFGIDAVLLSPGCASPLYRKSVRTSMGATLRIPFTELPSWPQGLGELRDAGFALLGLTPDDTALDIARYAVERAMPTRAALLAGTEGSGLSEEVRALVDERVRIPMAAGVDSLNVATALAIAMHRLAACESG